MMRSRSALGSVDARRPAIRARMRRVLHGLAVAGLVVAMVGLVLGWIMVGRLDGDSRRSLEVTVASLDSIEQTVATADTVLRGATDTLTAVGATIDNVDRSFAATADLGTGVADLADTLAPALADTGGALRQLEDAGGQIDALLAALSTLPLTPDYRPKAGLGPTFGAIAEDLAPLPDSLRSTSEALRRWDASGGELQGDLQALSSSVGELSARLNDSTALIGRYQANIADARNAAEAAKDDLSASTVVVRALLLVGAIAFAAMQVVPWWLARELAAETAEPEPTESAGDPPDTAPPPSMPEAATDDASHGASHGGTSHGASDDRKADA